jgi:hypothetical protein
MSIETSIIRFASYTKPEPDENEFRGWVLNGKKNEFYQYIIDMQFSPTNGSICKTYIDLILGRGLAYRTSQGNASQAAQDWAKFKTILSDKTLRALVTDFQVFNAYTAQVIKTNGKGLSEIAHLPKQKVVPAIDKDKNIVDSYWVSKDWAKYSMTENTPEMFPAFGSSSEPIEIFYLKPYVVGQEYFETPDYASGLQSAEAEIEISNLNINSIKSGLSAGFMINVKNGSNLEPEDKKKFKKSVEDKLTGTTSAGSFIINFAGNDIEVEVVPFPTNEQAHKQWESLNDTAATKIMSSHRVISPSIVGLSNASGFSSVAEEMDMAEKQTMKRVIRPKQDTFLSGIKEILTEYDINLDLYFLPLTEDVSEVEPVQMSEDGKKKTNFSDSEGDLMLENLIGETITDEWELVDKRECLEENEDVESWAKRLIKPIQLAVIKSKPSDESYLDKGVYKVRYSYQEKYSSGRSRGFCIQMMGRTGSGVVYRLEDIDKASREGINKEFGHKGQSYDLYKFKGGVRCGHFWQEELYRLKKNTDGTYRPDKALSSSEEVENIPKSYRPRPAGHLLAPIAPKDMPNDGHHPNYVKKSK